MNHRESPHEERRGLGGILRRIGAALFAGSRGAVEPETHAEDDFNTHHQALDALASVTDPVSGAAEAGAPRPLPVTVDPASPETATPVTALATATGEAPLPVAEGAPADGIVRAPAGAAEVPATGEGGRTATDVWPPFAVDPLERTRAVLDGARRQMPGMLGVEPDGSEGSTSPTPRRTGGIGAPSQTAVDLRSLVEALATERNTLAQEVSGLRSIVAQLGDEVSRLVEIVTIIQSAQPAVTGADQQLLVREAPDHQAAAEPVTFAPGLSNSAAPRDDIAAASVPDSRTPAVLFIGAIANDFGWRSRSEALRPFQTGEWLPPEAADLDSDEESIQSMTPANSDSSNTDDVPAENFSMDTPLVENPAAFVEEEHLGAHGEPAAMAPSDSVSPAADRDHARPAAEPDVDGSSSESAGPAEEPGIAGAAAIPDRPPVASSPVPAAGFDLDSAVFSAGGVPVILVAGPFNGVKQVAAVEAGLALVSSVGPLQLVSYRGREATFRFSLTAPTMLTELIQAIEATGGQVAASKVDESGRAVRLSLGQAPADASGSA